MPNILGKCCVAVAGNTKLADGLQTYLLSRDHANLKSEFQHGNGKVCITLHTTLDCVCFSSVIVQIAFCTHSMHLLLYTDNS